MRPSSNNGSNLIVLTMLNASIVRAQRNRNLANLYDSRLFRLFKLVKFFLFVFIVYCYHFMVNKDFHMWYNVRLVLPQVQGIR